MIILFRHDTSIIQAWVFLSLEMKEEKKLSIYNIRSKQCINILQQMITWHSHQISLEVCGPANLYGGLYENNWAFAETDLSRVGLSDSNCRTCLVVDLPKHHILGVAFWGSFVARRYMYMRSLRYCWLLTSTKYNRFPTFFMQVP